MRGNAGLRFWTYVAAVTLLVGALRVGPLAAQDTPGEYGERRLTVRPRAMATATRTEQAGDFPLDSLEDYVVHVPPSCVGARRCPLLVFVPGAGQTAHFALKWQQIMADKYGIIVLLLNGAESPGSGYSANFDAALKQVLRRFAIAPEKIALLGRCAGGWTTGYFGGKNLDLFSRILPVSGTPPQLAAAVDPPNTTTEFLLDAGLLEPGQNFQAARELRQAGHRVKLVVTIRHHGENVDDYDFLGRWLQESWAIPDPAARPAPRVLDSVPVLTPEALTKMTTFWERFMQEPDSILMTGRRAHQREVEVSVGDERPTVPMMDMPALAATYPSVAAALKAAGLTAEQHDAYRVALLGALLADGAGEAAGKIAVASALAKNVAFLRDHPDEVQALEQAGVKDLDVLNEIGMDLPVDASTASAEEQARRHSAGIWRTP